MPITGTDNVALITGPLGEITLVTGSEGVIYTSDVGLVITAFTYGGLSTNGFPIFTVTGTPGSTFILRYLRTDGTSFQSIVLTIGATGVRLTSILFVVDNNTSTYTVIGQGETTVDSSVMPITVAPVVDAPIISLSFADITQTGVSVGFTNSGGVAASQTFEYGITTAYGTSVAVTATQTQVILDDLDSNQQYFFRVTATNSGGSDTETGSTMTASADAEPGVTTDAATSLLASSIRFNGTIDNIGSSAITARGFYWILGDQTTANTITNGAKIDATAGTINFSAVQSGLSPSSTYSFVAFATNSEGESTGLRLTAATVAQVAAADWIRTTIGATSGGTGGIIEVGSFGAWAGAGVTNISPTTNPTSADCGTNDQTCLISRSQSRTQSFTGGSRTDQYQCRETQSGSGTPSCPIPFGTATAVGQNSVNDFANVSVTGLTYDVNIAANTESLRVTNNSYVPVAPNEGTATFGWSGAVPAAGLSFGTDVLSFITNTGDATATVAVMVSTITLNQGASKPVSPSVAISFTIPNTFDNGGTGGDNYQFSATQSAGSIAAPTFVAGSAQVDGTSISNNGTTEVNGGYTVTAPTGSGGIVTTSGNGAGNFSIPPSGRGRGHSFSITNTAGTVSYLFSVTSSA